MKEKRLLLGTFYRFRIIVMMQEQQNSAQATYKEPQKPPFPYYYLPGGAVLIFVSFDSGLKPEPLC